MVERPPVETSFERLDPEGVAGRSFMVVRKGFDRGQVQAYLVSLGSSIRSGQQQIQDLRERVVQAGAPPGPEVEFVPQGVRLVDGEVGSSPPPGQAGPIDIEVGYSPPPGHAEPTEVVSRIDRLVGELERTARAMGSRPDVPSAGEVVELLEQAGEQARSLVELLQQAREQAEAEVEKGRAQGREIVEQAKALRLTVLRDMARRRQTARVQVERLRAGRDKLMATLVEARHSIDQSLESAKLSLAEAKVMADTAARRVEEEAGPSDLALLSELDDAQTVGMIPDSDPVEVAVEHPALASAGDSNKVEAVFARLRSRSDPPQEDREIMRDTARIPSGDG